MHRKTWCEQGKDIGKKCTCFLLGIKTVWLLYGFHSIATWIIQFVKKEHTGGKILLMSVHVKSCEVNSLLLENITLNSRKTRVEYKSTLILLELQRFYWNRCSCTSTSCLCVKWSKLISSKLLQNVLWYNNDSKWWEIFFW